jgi:tetratricopeptide (TPR) repeat protein
MTVFTMANVINKGQETPKIKRKIVEVNMKKLIVSFVLIATMSVGVIYFQNVVFSQTKPFTIVQIIRAISTPSKNKKALFKKIVGDVRSRGVDFPLTADREDDLRQAGATDELIEAIRQHSPKPKPTKTPIPTPTPKPAYSIFLEHGDGFFNKFDFDRAIEEYTKVLVLDPQNINALVQRGYAHQYKGNINRDFMDYNSAIKINASLASEPSMICVLYDTSKDTIDRAIENCNKAISAKPNFSLLYYKRATAYRQKQDYERAINDYTKATELYPNFYSAYLDRGSSLVDKKDYDKALRDFDKAISLNPNNPSALTARGQLFWTIKAFDKAIIEFNKVISLSPTKFIGYYWRGVAYMDKKDSDQALIDFNKAIEIDPKFPGSYYSRGILFLRKGKDNQAISEFTKAIELDTKLYRAYSRRGFIYLDKKKDYDKAIADYDKAIEIYPNSSDYNYRGAAYYHKKVYSSAIDSYNEAISIDPKNASAYRNRADAYEKSGQKDLARQDRKKADELEKSNKQ